MSRYRFHGIDIEIVQLGLHTLGIVYDGYSKDVILTYIRTDGGWLRSCVVQCRDGYESKISVDTKPLSGGLLERAYAEHVGVEGQKRIEAQRYKNLYRLIG